MLKLSPIKMDKVWGCELWIASTHPNGLQQELLDYCGGPHPLLAKVIQADDFLSVQVHPDDEAAVLLEGEGSVGKTECWYVLDAKPGARLVYGLKAGTTREALEAALEKNALEPCLNQVEVKKGDFIFIPSGTVHAIGAGLRLMEVQQSCDITYRLYDWGRPREIHVKKGLASIKSAPLNAVEAFPGRFECEYFCLEEVAVAGEWRHENSGGILKGGASSGGQSEGENPPPEKGGSSASCQGGSENPPPDKSGSEGNGAAARVEFFFVLSGSGSVLGGKEAAPESKGFAAEDMFALAPGERILFKSQNARVLKISAK